MVQRLARYLWEPVLPAMRPAGSTVWSGKALSLASQLPQGSSAWPETCGSRSCRRSGQQDQQCAQVRPYRWQASSHKVQRMARNLWEPVLPAMRPAGSTVWSGKALSLASQLPQGSSAWLNTCGSRLAGDEALKPNRVPMRILTKPLRQPSPQRIGNDIPGNCHNILFPAQSPVMKTLLPQPPLTSTSLVHCASTAGFNPAHQGFQGHIMKLDEPVEMVRHDDPGQGSYRGFLLRFAKLMYDPTSKVEIRKYRSTLLGLAGQQIEPARFGEPAAAQAVRGWTIHVGLLEWGRFKVAGGVPRGLPALVPDVSGPLPSPARPAPTGWGPDRSDETQAGQIFSTFCQTFGLKNKVSPRARPVRLSWSLTTSASIRSLCPSTFSVTRVVAPSGRISRTSATW